MARANLKIDERDGRLFVRYGPNFAGFATLGTLTVLLVVFAFCVPRLIPLGPFQPVVKFGGAAFAYWFGARMLQHTTIVLGEGALSVRKGPLPLPGQSFTVPMANIRDVWLNSRRTRSPGPSTTRDAQVWDVRLALVDGAERKVVHCSSNHSEGARIVDALENGIRNSTQQGDHAGSSPGEV